MTAHSVDAEPARAHPEGRPLLVTGATGFLGRALLERLAREPSPPRLRALVRSREPTRLPPGVERVVGDLREPDSLGPAVAGAGAIVHAAALVGQQDEAALRLVNVEGTAALADAARRAGARTFVLLSTSGVYGAAAGEAPRRESDAVRPADAYSASKLAAESAARAALGDAVELFVLRPTGLYGPGRDLYRRLIRSLTRRPLRFALPGDELVQPCHVDDATAAILRCLTTPRAGARLFNLAGPDLLPLGEIYRRLAELAGTRLRVVRLPRPVARLAVEARLALRGTDPRLAARWRTRARGEDVGGRVDAELATRELGLRWTPLERGLRETVEGRRLSDSGASA